VSEQIRQRLAERTSRRKIGSVTLVTYCALAGAAACAASTAHAAGAAGNVDDRRIANGRNEPQNWLATGGSWLEQHYSRLDKINVDNVSNLKPAWYADFDTSRNQESEPIVVDGVLYVSTAWSKVYALDARTGKQLWFYDPRVPQELGIKACCDVVNRGPAVYHGKVYVGTLDGRLVALDAATGNVIWSKNTVDGVISERTQMYSITGAPRVFKGKVVIGNGGADFGARGYVTAYDADSGRLVWRFYLVPGNPVKGPDHAASDSAMVKALPTWSGHWYEYGGGGTAWDAMVYDPELDQLYIGTGNGSPWNSVVRSDGKGDNLFLASIVAVNPDTGHYLWHYQVNPRESWDYSATMPMILADLRISGQNRKVLMQVPKNGFFYVIDRKTGKLISAEKTMPEINWAERIDIKTGRPVETPGLRYEDKPFTIIPGSPGVHNWPPMAYSPKTGLVYFGAAMSSASFDVAPKSLAMVIDGPYNNGSPHKNGAGDGKAALIAWNPVTQKAVWQDEWRGGGVLATAGGLVFQGRGTITGELIAVRADNGELLWHYHVPNNVNPGPISYAVDGEQYIAVASGSGAGALSEARVAQPGRLVVFKLGGTANLPPDPLPAAPANPPSETFSDASVKQGGELYGKYCGRCHGGGMRASNNLPDLRRVAELSDKKAWQTVVIDGALMHAGMISWNKFLSAGDAEDIRAYVAGEARILQKMQGAQGNKAAAQ
jgi:quinohemoprotein ethanol dehydrogenase